MHRPLCTPASHALCCIAGITSLLIGDQLVSLPTALRVAEKELMGDYAALWPLTKILDIGGTKRQPNLTPELNETST